MNKETVRKLEEHHELSVGLGYWITPDFVVKLSYHWIDGNRYDYPSDLDEFVHAVRNEKLKVETHVGIFQVAFGF